MPAHWVEICAPHSAGLLGIGVGAERVPVQVLTIPVVSPALPVHGKFGSTNEHSPRLRIGSGGPGFQNRIASAAPGALARSSEKVWLPMVESPVIVCSGAQAGVPAEHGIRLDTSSTGSTHRPVSCRPGISGEQQPSGVGV